MAKTTIPTKGLDLSSLETPWGFKGKNYLFVIGIDEYEHWPPLNCAVKDIEDFTKVLLDRYQFKEENVFSLKNKEATEQNILIEFKKLNKLVTGEDNLIVYFSGHGHYDEETEFGYWIPVNAKQGEDFEYQYLDTALIANYLKGIDSLHTFLIIDACFSGTMVTQLKSGSNGPKSERYKSRKILTSGRAEVVNDGPKGGNSPFAKGILVTLEKNSELYLRASKLIVDVVDYVENQAKQTPTTGTLFNSDDQGGDFVFHLKMDEDTYWKFVSTNPEVENYEKYLSLFPKGKFAKKAEAAIKNGRTGHRGPGEDFYEWMRLIKKKATYKEYLEFTEKHPNSRFVAEATDEMTRLDDVAYNKIKFLKASENRTPAEKKAACYAYLKNYPGATHEHSVRLILNDLNLST